MIKKKLILLCIVLLVIPLVYAGDYGAGAYSAGVYSIGEAPVTPVSPAGGGRTPSCTYNWECTNWFPAECPESGIQERICANKGTCTGTIGMPNQTRTCIYEGPTEPLFDIFLIIPQQKKEICAGEKIRANIELKNYGKIELLDAFMTYWIINENNTLIAELKDTRAVKDKTNFNVEIKIPELSSKGTYRLYAQITYSENKTAVAGESFEIIEGIYCKIYSNISRYILFIFAGFTFIVIIIFIIKKIKKKIKEKKKTLNKIKEKEFIIKRKPKKKEKLAGERKIIVKEPKAIIKKRPVQKYSKSPKHQKKFKKQMFEKLLEDTVKLKKQRKKKKAHS